MEIKEAVVIAKQKNGSWNTEDRLAAASLLIKAGYIASIEKRKNGKTTDYVVVGYVNSKQEAV